MAHRGRRVGAAVAAALLGGVFGLGPVRPAGAAPVLYASTPIGGWSVNGIVYAVLVAGDTVYVGGAFTQAGAPGGSPVASRANLAAFDRATGALRTGFSADTNGAVRALASDGTSLFVAGGFTSIRGTSRSRLAAVDPATGAIRTSFSANLSGGPGYALAARGTRLYVGGSFTSVAGQTRNRIAAVDTTNGAVDVSFNPNADALVQAIVLSPDGAMIYVGGNFTAIGGAARSYLAAVAPTTGILLPVTFSNLSYQVLDLDVSPDGTRVFGAVGGYGNQAAAWSTTTGTRLWRVIVDGDVQAVRYAGGNLYFGFHEGYQGDTNLKLLVADAATGALDASFRPPIDSFFGVRAIDATYYALVIGGEFLHVSGVATRGLAILPSLTGPDTTPPGVPTGLAVQSRTSSTVTLGWSASTDNVGLEGYWVFRDGAPRVFVSTTSFTDSGLPPGETHTYAVEAVDLAGNGSGPSAPVTASTPLSLVGRGSVWRYLDNGSDQATAWRVPPFDDAAWASGPAQLGYGDGDEATVVSYGPSASNKYITTYFRQAFTVGDPSAFLALNLQLLRDDGAVVYLNGAEVARSNMPTGTITSATRASTAVDGAGESTWYSFAVDPVLLVAGANTLAVEIHQQWSGSSDISFDLGLDADVSTVHDTTPPSTPTDLRVTGVTSTSVSLSWAASTDDVGVASYSVLRDDAPAGTTTGTSFIDSGRTPATTYTYRVFARDAAGNASPPSDPVGATTSPGAVTLVPPGSVWRYLDNGSNQGTAWQASSFDDAAWASGRAQLGYGDGDEATVVSYGPSASNKYITTYFRETFTVGDPSVFGSLTLQLLRDDGAVVYLNGAEVARSNMPTGTITYTTRAPTNVDGTPERAWYEFALDRSLLVAGANTLAVEVHQQWSGSSDLSFDLQLTAG